MRPMVALVADATATELTVMPGPKSAVVPVAKCVAVPVTVTESVCPCVAAVGELDEMTAGPAVTANAVETIELPVVTASVRGPIPAVGLTEAFTVR